MPLTPSCARAHHGWLLEVLRQCTQSMLLQFAARAVGRVQLLTPPSISLALNYDAQQHGVVFLPSQAALVVLLDAEQLRRYLSRVLSCAQVLDHSCVVCQELFTAGDGLVCASGHFICQEHIEQQVGSACGEPVLQLVEQPAIVHCWAANCGRPYGRRSLSLLLPASLADRLRVKEEDVPREMLRRRLEPEFNARPQNELDRLARLSEEERELIHHRHHMQNEILTLHCPRENCRQAFVDVTVARRCSARAASVAFAPSADCGNDATCFSVPLAPAAAATSGA